MNILCILQKIWYFLYKITDEINFKVILKDLIYLSKTFKKRMYYNGY